MDFDYGSSNHREISSLQQAILPETSNKGKCILRVSVKRIKKKSHLLLEFEAANIVSLRAPVNTNLRLISSAVKTLAISEKKDTLSSHQGKTEKLEQPI